MYRPVLVTAPAAPIVSLADAKAHLDVSYADKDALITALVAAAEAHLDGWTGILGRALVTQTWRQDFDTFCRTLRLPLAPATSVTSVTYDDEADVEQTVASTSYVLLTDDRGAFIRFRDAFAYPSVHSEGPSVRVTYVAGYGAAAAVPAPIVQAAKLLIRHWFDNPSAVNVGNITSELPLGVAALLTPFRRAWF